jgi:hypothetical protein
MEHVGKIVYLPLLWNDELNPVMAWCVACISCLGLMVSSLASEIRQDSTSSIVTNLVRSGLPKSRVVIQPFSYLSSPGWRSVSLRLLTPTVDFLFSVPTKFFSL